MAGLKPRPSDGDYRWVSGRKASGLKTDSCVGVSRMTAKKRKARADTSLCSE
jgi:hypothetical protein